MITPVPESNNVKKATLKVDNPLFCHKELVDKGNKGSLKKEQNSLGPCTSPCSQYLHLESKCKFGPVLKTVIRFRINYYYNALNIYHNETRGLPFSIASYHISIFIIPHF